MEKAFVYGMSVEGINFTDRVKETKRLKMDFENGMNVILVSPRRMGKSSIVKKVKSEITNPTIKVVYMDIYDCRSEYDFYKEIFGGTCMNLLYALNHDHVLLMFCICFKKWVFCLLSAEFLK